MSGWRAGHPLRCVGSSPDNRLLHRIGKYPLLVVAPPPVCTPRCSRQRRPPGIVFTTGAAHKAGSLGFIHRLRSSAYEPSGRRAMEVVGGVISVGSLARRWCYAVTGRIDATTLFPEMEKRENPSSRREHNAVSCVERGEQTTTTSRSEAKPGSHRCWVLIASASTPSFEGPRISGYAETKSA